MKRFIIEKSKKEFYTSHSGLALVGLCINRFAELPGRIRNALPKVNGISHADVLRSYLGLLCTGKSDFEAITAKKEDDFFKSSLDIQKVPSAETLRQRLDDIASAILPVINLYAVAFLKKAKAMVTPLETGHVPLDADVFPMDNSNTKKEGVSRTYHGSDGYAPIAAYLGREGWCLEIELRPGSQHSQKNFIPYLDRVIEKARILTSKKLLVRLDSAHDAIDTRVNLRGHEKVSYILKWNPRKQDVKVWHTKAFSEGRVSEPRQGKRVALFRVRERQEYEGQFYYFSRVVRVIERTIDKRGQVLLCPDIELEGWWTSLDLPDEQVIKLYQDHGTSEQFHSEFKTDLDIERLPSGKFNTNALIMSLAVFAYNILRLIGQLGLLGENAPVRHSAKRRRIKTVIQELIYLAGRLIETARRLKLRFSRHCPAFDVFLQVYNRLAFQ